MTQPPFPVFAGDRGHDHDRDHKGGDHRRQRSGSADRIGGEEDNNNSSTDSDDAADEVTRKSDYVEYSCQVYVDAAARCYSTVHQVTSLYRTGSFADCKPHIRDAFDCLMMKTKFKDVLQARRLKREQDIRSQHIWAIKTRDEAKRDWDATYRRL